jgi:hypothetical protein
LPQHAEKVLHAVIEFPDHHLLATFSGAPAADIAQKAK